MGGTRTLVNAMFPPRQPLRTSLAMAAFWLSVANAADAPTTYAVNLAPANKVGTKFSLVTDLTTESQSDIAMTMPGATAPQKQEQSQQEIAHFEGEAEVLAIFPNDSIQKVAVTVKNFIAIGDGEPMTGLPAAGAKIVAENADGKKSYTVDDQPASANVAKLLDDIIGLGNEKRTDQDIFGPTSPVAMNATWPVNSTALIAELKEGGDMQMDGAKGTVKLDAIKGSGADQVASFSSVFVVQGAKPTLPAGMTVDSMTMSGGISGEVPATAAGVERETITRSTEMAVHGSGNGIEIKVDSAGKQKKSVEVTFH
jgi:hypothetical protein